MASTYSVNLRLELQATGENRTTWGSKANNLFNMLEDAVAGYVSVAMGDSNTTLSTANGTVDEARNMMVNLTGTHTAIRTVTIPAVSKAYIIRNATTGGYAITVSNGTNTVNVANGAWAFIWTDGTEVYSSPALNASYALVTDVDDLSGVTNASGARTNLGLGSIATQSASAVSITGGSITGITDLAVADGGTGASSASAARTSLGLAIGSDVQAYDAQLADIAAMTPSDSNFIVGDGSNFVLESGSTVRTSLGLGTGDSPQFTAINIGHASDTTLARTGAGVISVEGVEVTLNSATQTLTNKTLTTPVITLEQGTSVAPTAEGRIAWDTDDDRLVVGDGSSTKTFSPNPASTAAGDIEYYTAANVKARLAKGTAGQVLTMNSGATAPEWASGGWTVDSAVTLSGTSVEKTSLASDIRRIRIAVAGMSTNGSSPVLVQLGTSSAYATSGYAGTIANLRSSELGNSGSMSSGFNIVLDAMSSSTIIHGIVELEHLGSNIWVMTFVGGRSTTNDIFHAGGSTTLGSTLTRVRITTVTGTDTFDAGSVRISYTA